MLTYVKGRTVQVKSKIFYRILNRINHSIARKNILHYPQLAIFAFDHIGLTLNLEGRYENSLLLLIDQFIDTKIPQSKSKSALDIGANIGNHSIFFANKFKKVYAFEPNPVTFELLKFNCKFAAGNTNISPFNFGLSDMSGRLPFFINPINIGGSAIVDSEFTSINDSIEINVHTLDQISELKNVDLALIKIDVEGHELNVLKGAEDLIRKQMPAILFEQQPSEIIDGTSHVISYLNELGYNFFTVKKNFYLGDNLLSKLISIFLRGLFGERLDFIETKHFNNTFYDMILAMPKSR